MAEKEKQYDVCGIGNALVDFLVEVDEKVLEDLNLKKGRFHLVDEHQAKAILDRVKYANAKICAGGSVANTIAGISSLGGKAMLVGAIGQDEYGSLYEKETIAAGTLPRLAKRENLTGHCVVFITPDAERTFAVHYGAATEIGIADIIDEDITSSKILHLEGYQLVDPELLKACEAAIETAKKNQTLVSIDLGDPGIVGKNRELFLRLVKEHADIVFANEEEALELTGKDNAGALDELSKVCSMVIIKMGANGSVINHKGVKYKINPVKTRVVDTTGAGDAYAAGFLYGLTNGLSMQESGNLASMLAAKVVAQIGARLPPEVINMF